MLIARIREWCRSESLGIVVPVGVISLWVTWELTNTVVGSFVYPVLVEAFDDNRFNERLGLEFTVRGVRFQPDTFVISALSALVLGLLLYLLFCRSIPEDDVEEEPMRECPECLSEILIEARRCAFCTAEVAAIMSTNEGPSEGG